MKINFIQYAYITYINEAKRKDTSETYTYLLYIIEIVIWQTQVLKNIIWREESGRGPGMINESRAEINIPRNNHKTSNKTKINMRHRAGNENDSRQGIK